MGEVVALALGIAASPFAILPAVLLLFSPQPRASALAYLLTWFASIAVVTTIFALLSGVIGSSDAPADWLVWVRIAAGIGLIGVAVQQWVTRPTTPKTPRWMEKLQSATPRSAGGLAFLLSIANPKIVLLAAVAGADIGGADWQLPMQFLVVATFAGVASITVALPVAAHVAAGARVLGPLTRIKDWLIRNNVAVVAAVFVVLGIGLVSNGVSGL
jgi:threonine/homoserine/homoserine lactone efflux protein